MLQKLSQGIEAVYSTYFEETNNENDLEASDFDGSC